MNSLLSLLFLAFFLFFFFEKAECKIVSIKRDLNRNEKLKVIAGISSGRNKRQYFTQNEVRNSINVFLEAVPSRFNHEQFQVTKSFTNFPYVALEVNYDAYEYLLSSSNVWSLEEDTLSSPSYLENLLNESAISETWGFGYTGQGQVVAILDTGIQGDHPMVSGRILTEACFSTTTQDGATSLCPNNSSSFIGFQAAKYCNISGCEHGTHVAGIISVLAPSAKIIPIQVFSQFNSTLCGDDRICALSYRSDQLAALNYIYGLRNTYNIAAISVSLGSGKFSSQDICSLNSPSLEEVIFRLRESNILTVVASGNEYYTDSITSPACLPSAISVGAVSPSNEVLPFSNSASFLTFLAPGSNVTSGVPVNAFQTKSGTSMSTPVVSASFALYKSKYPDASAEVVIKDFKEYAIFITDSRNNVITPRVDPFNTIVRRVLSPKCGDGKIGVQEQCDDGNNLSLDGCNSSCRIERGYICNISQSPSYCTLSPGARIIVYEGFDGNVTSFVTNDWRINYNKKYRGQSSMNVGGNNQGIFYLNSTSIYLPFQTGRTTLRFASLVITEEATHETGCFDGATVLINGKQVASFNQPYTFPFNSDNFLGTNYKGWCSVNSVASWKIVYFDLNPFRGTNITIQWIFAADSAINSLGWWIDEVFIIRDNRTSNRFNQNGTRVTMGLNQELNNFDNDAFESGVAVLLGIESTRVIVGNVSQSFSSLRVLFKITDSLGSPSIKKARKLEEIYRDEQQSFRDLGIDVLDMEIDDLSSEDSLIPPEPDITLIAVISAFVCFVLIVISTGIVFIKMKMIQNRITPKVK